MAEPQGQSPEVRAKLMQLREEFAKRAEMDRRRQLGQQHLEDAMKKTQPLRPLGAVDGMSLDGMQYALMANGGQPRRSPEDVAMDALLQEPSLTMDERFRKHVAPVVREGLNSGLDAMFPMRGLAREAFKKGVFLPVANFYKKNANDLDDADVQGKVEEYKRMKEMELRNKIGLRQLPVEYDLSKFNRRLTPNSFPNPDNPIETLKNLERDWTELLSQPKAQGGAVTHAHQLEIEERPL